MLYLASWYPNRLKPLEGIFIEKHAEAVAKLCEVSVLYVTLDPNLKPGVIDIVTRRKNDVSRVIVYVATSRLRPRVLASTSNALRFIRGTYLGIREIRNMVKRIDLIQVNVASRLGIVAILTKVLKHVPFIVFEHSSIYIKCKDVAEYRRQAGVLERLFTHLNFRYAEAIVGVSDYLNQAIRRIKRIENKYYIVPNIVDVTEKVLNREKRGDNTVAITVATLNNRDKNIYGLITAFGELSKKGRENVRLHIVGDGPDRRYLEEHARNLGLLDRVVYFMGYVPNDRLGEYLGSANFFVLPSKYETFSVVTVEAIANGVPVVVTRSGGPEEIVRPEEGIIVENLDLDALVDGIEYMAMNWQSYDPDVLRKYALDNYSRSVVGKKLFDLYKRVVEC